MNESDLLVKLIYVASIASGSSISFLNIASSKILKSILSSSEGESGLSPGSVSPGVIDRPWILPAQHPQWGFSNNDSRTIARIFIIAECFAILDYYAFVKYLTE